MCQMCDDPQFGEADLRAQVFAMVDRGEWMVIHVAGDEDYPPFAYTVGLTSHGLPEVVIEGEGPQRSARLLNAAAAQVVADSAGPCSTIVGPDGGEYLLGLRMDPGDLFMAFEVYGRQDVDALELTRLSKVSQ